MTTSAPGVIHPRTLMWLGIAGVLILALGARTGVAALSPLAGDVELDVPLDGLRLGVLGTIPPIAYALAGLITPRLVRALSLEGVALAVSLLTATAHIARGFAPNYFGLFAATVVLMLGVGSINVILPGLVKLYAPHRIGQLTSLYSTAMALSTAAPAGVGLWIAEGFDWRWSLASWSLISVLAVVPWLILMPSAWARRSAEGDQVATLISPTRMGQVRKSPTAVAITVVFSVSGITAYSVFALLPPVLIDQAGQSPGQAALALTIFSIMGMPMSLTIPMLAVRQGWPARLVILAALSGASGFLGLALAPALAPVLWAVLAALGTLTFSMSLALIGARTHSHHMATTLSGFVNTVGYTVAASGPILTGALHELTGDWRPSLFVLAGLCLVIVPTAVVFARNAFVEDELAEVDSRQ